MSVKASISLKQVIDLTSSSPPRRKPSPSNDLMSSSLPSPSTMLKQFSMMTASATADMVQPLSKGSPGEPSVWDAPDDTVEGQEKASPPKLPLTRRKHTAKATTDSGITKKPRAPWKTKDNSKAGKNKPSLRDGKLKGKVVKSAKGPSKSKYFEEQPEGGFGESGPSVNDSNALSDNSALQHVSSKQSTLAQASPNQQLAPDLLVPVIRRQWTPIKNTALYVDSPPPLMGGEIRKSKRSAFDGMVGVMRYTTNSRQSSQGAPVSKEDATVTNGLRNKRPLEIIGFPSTTIETKEQPIKLPIKFPKQKQPKRKAKTITDQATAPFREPVDSPIIAYFAISESEGMDPQNVSRKHGSPAKKKKQSPEVIVLLSPTSAKQRFDSQDFIFGTSSQLEQAGENKGTCDSQLQIGLDNHGDDYNLSPPSTSVPRKGFLKSLAKERKGGSIFRGNNAGSNDAGYEESGANMTTSGVPDQPHQNALGGRSQLGKMRQTASGLWEAAARDHDGELMPVEVVDMTGIDNIHPESASGGWNEERTVRELPGDENVTTGSNTTGRPVSQNALYSCHDPHREPLLVQHERSGIQMIESLEETPHTTISSSRGVTASLKRSTKSAGSITSTGLIVTKSNRSTASEKMKLLLPMPDFQSYPTARLKLDVAKNGYKDMKTRDKMVSCLETCWEAKNKAATAQIMSQKSDTNIGPVQNTAEFSEKGLSEEEPALVLQDAVSTEVVAKGRRTARKPKRKIAPKSKKTSKVSSHDSGESDYTNPLGSDVHRLISEAVRESGKLHSEFSFHHAMLMYDPIVLEDMTLWLNEKEEFKGLGVDEKVVKAWCEAKGVCCAKNETRAGKGRTRK